MKQGGIGKFYFGWNIVLICSMITLLTVGTRMGIGPFFKPILDDMEMSRTSLSFVVAISMLAYGLGMPLAGKLVDRHGTRFVLLAGIAIVLFSIVWTVFTRNVLAFTLAYGILLSVGLSFTSPVAMTPLVSRWFTRQRGKALFYLSTGSMGGIAIMTPVFSYSIHMIGWRSTLLLLAAVFVLLLVPAVLYVIRDDAPEGTDQLPDQSVKARKSQEALITPIQTWTQALSTRTFWQISFGLFVCGFSMNLLGSHGVPMLTDHGFSNATASFGIGLIGVVAMLSTVLLGELSDHLSRKHMLALIYAVRGLGFLSLVLIMTPGQLYIVSMIGGLVWAGSTALSSAILGDVYGVRWVGVLYGWGYFIHQIGGAVGSFLAGWGYESFGTHIISFGMAAILLGLASIVSLQLPSKWHVKTLISQQKNA
ncbi:MFS transporter [Aneurinibacillus sp. REN35]|uniref:MFS transporter n=1 Tax=Aneurinibacillus sp. REN35 TaxID=3237286 RepID=UPI003528FC4E